MGAEPDSGWHVPCRDDPDSWDLDLGDVGRWLRAMRVCRESCPFLAECVAARTRMYPAAADPHTSRSMPSGVIWAGIAYSDRGHVLSEHLLRRLGSTIRNRSLRDDSTRPATADRHAA